MEENEQNEEIEENEGNDFNIFRYKKTATDTKKYIYRVMLFLAILSLLSMFTMKPKIINLDRYGLSFNNPND